MRGAPGRIVLVAIAFGMSIILVIGMTLFAVFRDEQAAFAANPPAGSAGAISVNPADLKAAVTNPNNLYDGKGIFSPDPDIQKAYEQAVTADVTASVMLPGRVGSKIPNCYVPWQMIAAIGTYESSNGTSGGTTPFFDSNGTTLHTIRNQTAEGPMQIEDGTWDGSVSAVSRAYNVSLNPDLLSASRDNLWDSALGAATLICMRTPADYRDLSNYSFSQLLYVFDAYCTPAHPDKCPYDMSNRAHLTQVLENVSVGWSPVATAENALFTGGSGGSAANCLPTGALSSQIQQVISYACAQLGKPYVFAAAGPNSFDCSGLTMMAYRQIGVNLPHKAEIQYAMGQHIPDADLQPGDLVFFNGYSFSEGGRYGIGHVAMYLGDNQMIEAPHTGDVVKIMTYSTYNPGHHAGGSRYIDTNGNRLPDWGGPDGQISTA